MAKPVLWHIPISHYSEKVRWALELKGVEHDRHAPPPGAHMAVAMWLTRGAHKTFPVLGLDGENIGDSTAIIAALEQRWPEPPLYPADPGERRRALELEEFFDEELAPPLRLLAWHELRRDPESMAATLRADLPPQLRDSELARAGIVRLASTFTQLRYRVGDEDAAAAARTQVIAALERLEAELDAGEGDYLVGSSFSVADLTAAALFYPLVLPPEGPRAVDPPEALQAFREPLLDRPGVAWVREMFRRHRRSAATSAPA